MDSTPAMDKKTENSMNNYAFRGYVDKESGTLSAKEIAGDI